MVGRVAQDDMVGHSVGPAPVPDLASQFPAGLAPGVLEVVGDRFAVHAAELLDVPVAAEVALDPIPSPTAILVSHVQPSFDPYLPAI